MLVNIALSLPSALAYALLVYAALLREDGPTWSRRNERLNDDLDYEDDPLR